MGGGGRRWGGASGGRAGGGAGGGVVSSRTKLGKKEDSDPDPLWSKLTSCLPSLFNQLAAKHLIIGTEPKDQKVTLTIAENIRCP